MSKSALSSLDLAICTRIIIDALAFNGVLREEIVRRGGCVADTSRPATCGSVTGWAPGSLAWIDLTYEAFTLHPKNELRGLCIFLGVQCSESYLSAAAGNVRAADEKRNNIWWPAAVVRMINEVLRVTGSSGAGTSAGALAPMFAGYLAVSGQPKYVD